jgi:hypothetical protein
MDIMDGSKKELQIAQIHLSFGKFPRQRDSMHMDITQLLAAYS